MLEGCNTPPGSLVACNAGSGVTERTTKMWDEGGLPKLSVESRDCADSYVANCCVPELSTSVGVSDISELNCN